MIFVSAGHHMNSKGLAFKQYNEYDEVKIWQSLIVNHLGFDAMAVPNGFLKEKVSFINSWSTQNDIAVELHLNTGADQHGSETLYYPQNVRGLKVAAQIQDDLSEILPPNRGASEGHYHMNPVYGPDWFLKTTNCTAVIIQPEFIENMDLIIRKRDAACLKIATTLKMLTGP